MTDEQRKQARRSQAREDLCVALAYLRSARELSRQAGSASEHQAMLAIDQTKKALDALQREGT